MKRLRGFTLAEVLITLAIIGVVAAISIPSVISNSQQQEFKTGLRKAVSVLNSAITMNMAIDGESPYENKDLFNYLQRHMSIMKSTTKLPYLHSYNALNGQWFGGSNSAFYTTDGMRFEGEDSIQNGNFGPYLHEKRIKTHIMSFSPPENTNFGGCGSYGLNSNTDNTTKPPCVLLVDVNGDRKPNPANVNCTRGANCEETNAYKVAAPDDKRITDIFTIMITDKQAIPYGVVAQRAMYQAQK